MVIENKKRIIRLQLSRLGVLLLLGILSVLFSYSVFIDVTEWSFEKNWIFVGIALLYVLYIGLGMLRRHSYFYFSDMGTKLIVRYYLLRPFASQKSIEIRKADYAGYKIETVGMGFRKKLIVYQRLNQKKVGYPPVSLTKLHKSQIEDLERILSSYKPN